MKYQFISSNPRPSDLNESNDCAVRATALASDLDYKLVHEQFTKRGRKPCKGTFIATMLKVAQDLSKDSRYISFSGMKKPTLKQFLIENPKGHWVICRSNHAFAVKNGVVYDAHESQAGARCRVIYAIKIKD